jgi:hypothetical protein
MRKDVSTTLDEQALLDQMAKGSALTMLREHREQARQTESAPTTQPTQQRTSTRQRRASLDDYREAFLVAPKIVDRQHVFVSRETRDRIDSVGRRLGERKMSVSGFLENLARHHLELYTDDLEQWRRM